MTKFTITVVDTTGKQNYIFSSNRLRENIGASYLLSQATKGWVEETLEKMEVPKNRQEEPIESSGLKAEMIYAGGGNALILFQSRAIAVEFTEILSKRVLKEASGVNLLVAHAEFDWDDEKRLSSLVEELKSNHIERQKYERAHSAPLLGLGVTASCNSTQLPAIGRSNDNGLINYEEDEEADGYLISTETKQKLKAVSKANAELQDFFKGIVDKNIFPFPYRTDHLGRSRGESSYAAIVHADGNGMGKRFKKYGKDKNNRDYVLAMREFSKSVDEAGRNALKDVVKILTQSIQEGKVVGKLGEFELNSKNYLPFRPLVYGGDDITFICEGRLGLDLAALFIKQFEKKKVADNDPLTACAGVCVVKTHYPFARAYETSEDLCKKAKGFMREERKKYNTEDYFSAIDWHLAASGLVGSISEIRDREYKILVEKNSFDLTMRPVRLQENASDCRTWDGFTQVVTQFKQGSDWKERQNKIMALREVLRKASSEAIQDFLATYKLPNLPLFPELSGNSGQLAQKGWLNNRCGYFDAIEAMEFYLGLGN
ncbi:hypothetical protein DSM106972_079650 [Dulcicalothrix desertica PCC 7102]|uniref:Cas10/Cmr2 second palm domain-containing protein n=1 Tax=Dulcicalothrix desertica PCC 7102 TaxID=232991 RepID=A0A3S1C1I9_9CYAN|nr:hypothetical protein [Dulcicalothrix desertica]RUS98579.1 hypothetical protein DSM106972_079650 [Dulcicalothrix desertica PCC 7102]TWH43086.1 hypothetical protein CAL7102_06785 [Dulcicalothrix desertica PCC 7102]